MNRLALVRTDVRPAGLGGTGRRLPRQPGLSLADQMEGAIAAQYLRAFVCRLHPSMTRRKYVHLLLGVFLGKPLSFASWHPEFDAASYDAIDSAALGRAETAFLRRLVPRASDRETASPRFIDECLSVWTRTAGRSPSERGRLLRAALQSSRGVFDE